MSAQPRSLQFQPTLLRSAVAADLSGRPPGRRALSSFIDGHSILDVDVQGRSRTQDGYLLTQGRSRTQDGYLLTVGGAQRVVSLSQLAGRGVITPRDDEVIQRMSDVSAEEDSLEEWGSSPWVANFGSSRRLVVRRFALPRAGDDSSEDGQPWRKVHGCISFEQLSVEQELVTPGQSPHSSLKQSSTASDDSVKSHFSALHWSSSGPEILQAHPPGKRSRPNDPRKESSSMAESSSVVPRRRVEKLLGLRCFTPRS
jgi:hypothetical protein